jgi:ubiquinone/menaquinone biosynthesis C-methylase UbiE
MRRVDAPEILDSDACSPAEILAALEQIASVNRNFGGITTSQNLVERAAKATGLRHLSLLEVAAGLGEVPETVRRNLARKQITLEVTLLDVAKSHLPGGNHSVVGNALRLPFRDNAFDLVSCNLFAHHLNPAQLQQFLQEGLRVCRHAVLINDLVRHPLHLGLVYISYPIMRSRIAWLDGLTSVRRAYTPTEIQQMIELNFLASEKPRIEIFRSYLFRMGVTLWKPSADKKKV